MQTPMLVFDHIKKQAAALDPAAPANRKQLAALADAQRKQVTTSSGQPAGA